jgi:hypothetical protein
MNGWAARPARKAQNGVAIMIRIVAAMSGAVLLAGTVVLLSGMTPPASDPLASAGALKSNARANVQSLLKGDRIDIRSYGPGCSERGWPYYEASCIRNANAAGQEAKRVRLVTTDRLPADVRFATSR